MPVKLVLAAQPTRGLDVGSIEYIHRRLIEQRDAGAAILIVSTELDEVVAVGDRIAVMFEGRIVGTLAGDGGDVREARPADGWRRVRRGRRMTTIRELGRETLVPFLALVTALLFGAVVIILTDLEACQKLGTDPIGAISGAVGGVVNGYGAMLAGAFGDPGRIVTAFETGNAKDIATAIRPFTETLVPATPLIFRGLAVAISFRAGMFNIGVDGQLMIGALGATIAAFALQGQVPPP